VPNHGPTTPTRLGDYLQLLRRQWATVALGLILGLGSAVAWMSAGQPEYVSRASVLVTPVAVPGSPGPQARRTNLDTEAQIVTSGETAAAVAERMGLPDGDAADLAEDVSVSVPPNSEVLTISFRAGTAATAQRGAEEFAQAYLDARQDAARAAVTADVQSLQARIDILEQELEDLTRANDRLPEGSAEGTVDLNRERSTAAQLATLTTSLGEAESDPLSPGRVIRAAALPSAPRTPDPFRVLSAGAALGLLVGIGGAAFRQRWDDRLRNAADLTRRTSVRVAATLPTPLRGDAEDLAPSGPNALAVARLTSLVGAAIDDEDTQIVLVVGVRRGGADVAANLASSLARSGEPVCLLDAGAPAPAGSIQPPTPLPPNLRLGTLGRYPDEPVASLSRGRLTEILDGLRANNSFVVVHGPPITGGVDAQSLAVAADVVVLVVEVGRARAHEVSEAVAELESAHTPVLGAVVLSYRRRPFLRRKRGHRRPQAWSAGDAGMTNAAATLPAVVVGSGEDEPAREPYLRQGLAR
jgi:Mrp family chromosome partitioning ATPase/capsular polysaccharide biosynthesis protein